MAKFAEILSAATLDPPKHRFSYGDHLFFRGDGQGIDRQLAPCSFLIHTAEIGEATEERPHARLRTERAITILREDEQALPLNQQSQATPKALIK
jgi:hypothetical protein